MFRTGGCYLAALLLSAWLLAGCAPAEQGPQVVTLSGLTMGTSYQVKYFPAEVQSLNSAELDTGVAAVLEDINGLMSTYRDDSEISRFSRAPAHQWFPISPATAEVIELAQQISAQTGGVFDISVASLVDLWGFGPTQREAVVPPAERIAAELARIGYRHLELDTNQGAVRKATELQIDLSAIAKGYAADKVADYLRAQGIDNFLVEIGGELVASGYKAGGEPWRIAIESPLTNARGVEKIISLENTAVATSGDYRNYFEQDGVRYSHTIDPTTGYPIEHRLASVTVLQPRAGRADALATAFMVMGPEKSLEFANVNEIPAFFIIKTDKGFEHAASAAFARQFE